MQTGDQEAILDGVPEGATFRQARELILPARTWIDTGFDGIEIYLDADQNGRLLVRQVIRAAGPTG